jgi:hypothetical protein
MWGAKPYVPGEDDAEEAQAWYAETLGGFAGFIWQTMFSSTTILLGTLGVMAVGVFTMPIWVALIRRNRDGGN